MNVAEFFEILVKNGYVRQDFKGHRILFNKENGIWIQDGEKHKDIIFGRIPDINRPFAMELLWSVAFDTIEDLKFENGCFIYGDRLSFRI